MRLRNDSGKTLGLPDAISLPPGASKDVKDHVAHNKVVAAWIAKGMLVIESGKPAALPEDHPSEELPETDEKQTLINELADLGYTRDKRTSVENLRKLRDEALAEKSEQTEGDQE